MTIDHARTNARLQRSELDPGALVFSWGGEPNLTGGRDCGRVGVHDVEERGRIGSDVSYAAVGKLSDGTELQNSSDMNGDPAADPEIIKAAKAGLHFAPLRLKFDAAMEFRGVFA